MKQLVVVDNKKEKLPYPGQLVPPPMEPLVDPADLGKGIIVPRDIFERTLEELDWTYHQITRGEFPYPFNEQGKDYRERLQLFQLAIICEDSLLWCTAFLREPEDPDHLDPYQFFDYQIPSLRDPGSVVHQDGAEVGKTREIVAWTLWKNFTVRNGSGLIGAPQQIHLDEIIDAKLEQLDYNPALARALVRHKKQPHHQFKLSTPFKEDYRPSGHDGQAYRGVHARTFVIKDEAAKDKNVKTWSEFWRASKPGAVARIYSVPDGDRETEYYRLTMAAEKSWPPSDKELRGDDQEKPKLETAKEMPANMTFTRYRWSKRMMPFPYWSPERKQFYIKRYNGEDSPEFRHNVDGEHGDPVNTVFPWHQLKLCVRDVPEYRCLKVLVDAGKGEVLVSGYRCDYEIGIDGPTPRHKLLIDDTYPAGTFFRFDDEGDSEFKRLIRGFFSAVPGLKRGGSDFGFSPDPTEITIWNIIGKRERLVGRLQLKQVTYDQQCQAQDAMDDVYGTQQESLKWGTDFGNAGSAVAHDLQGLQIYEDKNYDDRLSGFMFQSTTDNIDENGEPLLDPKSQKPVKITLKELATDLIVKKVQRQEMEYPADEDIISAYTNHTCRQGERQRIYSKDNDHLIDSQRVATLAGVLGCDVEDLFA
jgi:hypothetical protein